MLPLLLAAVLTSTAVDVTSPGVALAHDLAAHQRVDCEEAVGRFLRLPQDERARFIETWPRFADGDEAMGVYAAVKAEMERERPPERVCDRIERGDRLARARRYDARLSNEQLTVLAGRSPAAAWALSFFVGFGIGNFYADAPAWGGATLASELLGALLAVAGASSGDDGLLGAGIAINRAAWVCDWAGAIVNARTFNEGLRARLGERESPRPPTFSLTFEF